MIKLTDVCKAYGEKKVLSHISLAVEEGERICVMGSSGRGKTTLLRLIAGLERPDSGVISVPPGYRFSMVFQEDRLMENMSAIGNVKLASVLPEHTIENELLSLGIEDTHAPVSSFSGGMKRRVALCRALLASSDALLMDEPYKGLDEATRERVAQECSRLLNNRTCIIVSHDWQDTRGMRLLRLEDTPEECTQAVGTGLAESPPEFAASKSDKP